MVLVGVALASLIFFIALLLWVFLLSAEKFSKLDNF